MYRAENILVKPDRTLLLCLLFLLCFGVLCLLSASGYESEKFSGSPYALLAGQSIALCIGIVFLVAGSLFNYHYLRKLSPYLALFCLLSLLLVKFSPLGITAGGARRWIDLGIITFQPSELCKVSVLLLLSDGLSRWQWFNKAVILRVCLCLLMVGLILRQPDLGTSALLVLLIGLYLFFRGMNMLLVTAIAGSIIYGGLLLIKSTPYQNQRLMAWLDPSKDPAGIGYNLMQSYYAIAENGLWGTGYGNSFYKMGHLPISHADFVFPIICEEMGIVGAICVLGALMLFLWRGLAISVKVPGRFGRLLGIGIVFLLSAQSIFNLGGVTGLLPVTGIPLPLISYGKTSLIVTCFLLGVLINLSRQRRIIVELSDEKGAADTQHKP